MSPEQQNQPGGPPQSGPNTAPQQAANGQYEVVPPLPTVNNDGHSGHNPYEFIVNPQAQHHKKGLFGGNKFALQIAVLVGGLVVVMVVIAVLLSVFGPKSSTADLVSLAQTQNEIARVADESLDTTVTQDATNLASNIDASITSSQNQTLSYLSDHGTTPKDKQLALKQDNQTDTLLTNAITNNTYDATFTQTMISELTSYENQLQTAYNHTSSTSAKQLIQNCYNSAALLIKQAKAIQTGS